MSEIFKNKNREECIDIIYDLHLQNTNGRETNEEMFKLGIEACYDEMLEMQRIQSNIFVNKIISLKQHISNLVNGKT